MFYVGSFEHDGWDLFKQYDEFRDAFLTMLAYHKLSNVQTGIFNSRGKPPIMTYSGGLDIKDFAWARYKLTIE